MIDQPQRTADKVCIVGFAPNRTAAPWGDLTYELWGFNDCHYDYPLVLFSRWFQLHDRKYLENNYTPWLEAVKDWKLQRRIPVYMREAYDDIPMALEFPKKRIEAELPRGEYHASTFDWLVAFAILEGFKEIRIDGLSGLAIPEPISARACLEYWLGVAEGRGIKTVIPRNTEVFRIFQLLRSDRQYAWDDSRPVIDLESYTPGVD